MDDNEKIMEDVQKQMAEQMRRSLEASGLPPEMIQQMIDNALQAQQNFVDIAGGYEDDEEDEEYDQAAVEEFVRNNQVPSDKMKYMMIGATLIGTHGEPYTTLALMQDEEYTSAVLEGGWGIYSRDEGLKMLESLLHGRHAVRFGEMFKAIKSGNTKAIDEDDLEDYEATAEGITEILGLPAEMIDKCNTLMAWDLERIGYLSRLFLNMGYISEGEAWEWMKKAAKEIKKHFSAWEEYFVSMLIGRGFAMGVNIEPFAVAHDLLTDSRALLDSCPISDY